MQPTLVEEAAARYALGRVMGRPEARHGGVNRLWRVRTDRGEFAVHALGAAGDVVARCDDVFALETAAAAAGVAVAPPVVDPVSGHACTWIGPESVAVTVHHWVDAAPADCDRSGPELYHRLGRSVALVHGLEFRAALRRPDPLDDLPGADGWRQLAGAAAEQELPWAADIGAAADELAAAASTLSAWESEGGNERAYGHRDLTSQNVLDLDGVPVLIDWEDAGDVGRGDEVGRTALDNLGRDGVLDPELLRAYLRGYAGVAPLPRIGRHWCCLWIRGLLLFSAHCAREAVARRPATGRAGADSLHRLQSDVVRGTVPELRRRLALADDLARQFELSARS